MLYLPILLHTFFALFTVLTIVVVYVNTVSVAIDPKVQNYFFNTIQPVSLDIFKPWSVTCPSTLESLQKLEVEINNDINVKVSLCQGDITKLNVDFIVNSVNKTLLEVLEVFLRELFMELQGRDW